MSREARLGRGRTDGSVQAVVLMLPAGKVEGSGRPSPLAAAAMRPLGRRLARAGREDGLAVHVVHYRCCGWNGDDADLACDAGWALDEAVRRYGDVPVCLIGTDMGGRAALRAAGHEAVHSVVALAPWLPEQPGDAARVPAARGAAAAADDAEPVRQLVGRQVLIVHGTNDERTDPELSYRLAERVKKVNPEVCRFEVHSDRHGMHQHRAEVAALAVDFVIGSLYGRGFSRPVADALVAPPPLGLRMPLASGFGAALRH
ncbi:alpha/beta hydrolase [Streptomyces sp. A7024]|uniref:Alpha/beta hydrolase n=1 Tax=Streptomyces coryli TaxID=1128680 RepID=A0A6G4UBB4_9ACTN|nr:alpha/beta hydrolase [Streptomyces coryli]